MSFDALTREELLAGGAKSVKGSRLKVGGILLPFGNFDHHELVVRIKSPLIYGWSLEDQKVTKLNHFPFIFMEWWIVDTTNKRR